MQPGFSPEGVAATVAAVRTGNGWEAAEATSQVCGYETVVQLVIALLEQMSTAELVNPAVSSRTVPNRSMAGLTYMIPPPFRTSDEGEARGAAEAASQSCRYETLHVLIAVVPQRSTEGLVSPAVSCRTVPNRSMAGLMYMISPPFLPSGESERLGGRRSDLPEVRSMMPVRGSLATRRYYQHRSL